MATVKRQRPDGAPLKKKKGKGAPDDAAVEKFALPKVKSTPVDSLSEYTMFLFGEKKIGKTSMLAHMEDAIFLMTEPGGKSLAIYQVPITRWKHFTRAVELLETDTRFKTVVVDIADHLFKMCERAVCAKLGIDHPSEEDWGKGWGALRDEFTKWIQRLMNIPGKGVIFTSHAVEKKIKRGRNGPEYDRVMATLSGQAKDVIEGMVDMWFYYTYDGDRRVLTLQGDEHISAGHRLTDRFKTPKGKALKEIVMGTSAQEAHHNFMEAFHNRYIPPVVEDESTATRKVIKKKRRVA